MSHFSGHFEGSQSFLNSGTLIVNLSHVLTYTPLYGMYLSCSFTLFFFYSACHCFTLTPPVLLMYSLSNLLYLSLLYPSHLLAFSHSFFAHSSCQYLFYLSVSILPVVLILPIYSACFSCLLFLSLSANSLLSMPVFSAYCACISAYLPVFVTFFYLISCLPFLSLLCPLLLSDLIFGFLVYPSCLCSVPSYFLT
jgi:hypothetical protein